MAALAYEISAAASRFTHCLHDDKGAWHTRLAAGVRGKGRSKGCGAAFGPVGVNDTVVKTSTSPWERGVARNEVRARGETPPKGG